MLFMTNHIYAEASKNSRMNRPKPFALREWLTLQRLRWHLVALVLATIVFAYLGPFGTYIRMSFGERVAFWGLAMLTNWGFGIFSTLAMVAWLPSQVPIVARVVVGSLVAAIPGTATVAGIQILFDGKFPPSLTFHTLFFSVAIIHVVLGLIVWVALHGRLGRVDEPFSLVISEGDREETPPPILERLPTRLRGTLLHLQVQDHYVEIHTDQGSHLVLMRFGDALKELGGTAGMQVHRSHWIARDALTRITRNDNRTIAHLSNGASIPVSRRYAKELREANWV